MKTNVGTPDRIVRLVIGLSLLSLTLFGPQTWWGWLGVIPLATAAIGFCPLYTLFGLSTRRSAERAGRV